MYFPCFFAAAATRWGGCDPRAGSHHLRGSGLSCLADEVAEVPRAKEKDLEARNRGNLFDILQRLRGFDLKDEQPLGVTMLEVVGHRDLTVTAVGVAAVQRASAYRMETSHFDDLPAPLRVFDVGHHDGRRALDGGN